jgi:D-arabinose 1-dehydrogenase-like Zn-dependent alcohol dehydrogenase
MYTWTVYKGSPDGRIKESTSTRAELRADEVLLKVLAAGLCGTDEHFRHSDIVLGHEGVGVVEKIGLEVNHLRCGDRVGWGYQHDSCQSCKQCLSGEEIYCPSGKIYGVANQDQGAFGTHAIWKESFLFRLPDTLSNIDAAPMMCAGATVFSALKNTLYPGNVGILGMGGLGHLAIQFAAKQGSRVVVFSQSEEKRDDALKLGAQEFYFGRHIAKSKGITEKLDVLLITSSQQPGKCGFFAGTE